MKIKVLVIVIVVLATLGAVVVSRNIRSGIVTQPQLTQQAIQKTFPPQTDGQGEVSVEVTPKILEVGKEVTFQVTFTTHSVELDKDLVKVSKLTDDQGNEYLPVSWSGGTGGHHLSGELIFPKITENAKSAELQVSGFGGAERVFKWEL
ncbi:hypothetical protein A3A14_03525 [Candidatus Daviesbacteria bacterium RIFCSPLOWO2_01_FULL_43_38]|uniref:DUF4352 domain-containing protein n=3 Tax=Candidatus Daviesiibacteriota TaxID=1752718 RepID=A0A1F5K770_9BACT|nr:MAG: hypothetical protein UV41_C0011G0019 [Candidatus Daviesbacteria bacterium GW2011_GWA2_42_7]OGE20649.1 MAG: hypothetical protein A2874_02150 [Candidatus Daviesbacteria bacterium RIFCSPHIGHO2_01_FULL_43_17]OGE36793.1 MAG: hypothetical protein A3E45_01570 [Candidatus Daviesbacteria bacterium RIFCSPHIGHO2_12_FULL_43_11]OGE63711.1 MAG: hypothetical protein A3A14_03525 [Candidatus Daviesbacteria bacterium RIFCSPLOWO2_01_FULL_43_38]